MKFLVCFVILTLAHAAQAMKLEYIGETAIKTGTKFAKTEIGGLSGIAYHDGVLYALSDDKGRINNERFYAFTLKLDKKKITLDPKSVHELSGLPLKDGKKPGLDPEGLVRLFDGTFLISSEGNNDAKPREMSRIFHIDATGKWLLDLPVPDKFLPEETGKQTKGVQNNASFEGLTASPDGKFVFAGIEKALQQDVVANEEDKGDFIRIIKYEKGEKFKVTAEYAYKIDALMTDNLPKEIFRGVSEILAVSDTKILVMERGAKISPKKIWTSSIGIYLADFSKATDISGMEKLVPAKVTPATKTKLIDFELDLKTQRKDKPVDNFEALAWGPILPDGRKTLLVMSDNNFSKTQITELIVFAVEGE
ncbi:hypothetical protein AZI86_03365 [Bdellovibrio bacteriovorus]|uniref:Phytase-like domain-containing protein n=1 Tax=Bdellovibrio bacteriovorus TaxID=959 RepID=A0A150WP26_BDEBC|nr:esterase-like activity of phytase family protein [Bdellovibrio bacteriovorus]KYG66116.1 hypothetical protein AZI86_03365 [Bdellovibrio bacteriovorus]